MRVMAAADAAPDGSGAARELAPRRADLQWLVSYRRGALIVVYAVMGPWALARMEHRGSEALIWIALVAALLLWCTLDAPLHGREFHHGLAFPFLMTWPISVAYYLYWTRGRR